MPCDCNSDYAMTTQFKLPLKSKKYCHSSYVLMTTLMCDKKYFCIRYIRSQHNFVDRGRRLHSSMSDSYSGWCACSQTEVKRSREDGEGWLEWDKHAASSAIAVTRAVKGTQWWWRKSLEFGAHSCPSRTMQWSHSVNSPSVKLELWLWHSSLLCRHLQMWFMCGHCSVNTV